MILVCKLCGQEKKLVVAHIIPRSFYDPLREGGQIPVIITDQPGVYIQKSRTGVYDREILCGACERKLSAWDDYAYKFLMGNVSDHAYIMHRDKRVAYNLGRCDYNKLKLFFMSVLWRAGASKQPFFKNVQLGPYNEDLRARILAADPGRVEDYAVALSRFDAPPPNVGMLNPCRNEYGGVNHYQLYLGGYMAIVKVTNKKPPEFFECLYIAPGTDVIVLILEFETSKEFQVMANVVKRALLRGNIKRRGNSDKNPG